eukprot:gene5180-6448_t
MNSTSRKIQRIIGICGLNASGKSTVCEFYKRKGFSVVSLSDIIRKTLRDRNIDETRENLINMGNELRNKNGAGILAKMTIETLNKTDNYVIDSIRHPDEVKYFREAYNNNSNKNQSINGMIDNLFTLISIDCPSEIRYERIQSRKRVGDQQSLQQFMDIEKKEMNNPDPNGQQVSAVIGISDYTIVNNYENLNLFESQLEKLDTKILLDFNNKTTSTSTTSTTF